MTAGILLWRATISWRGLALPSRWWLFTLLLIAALAVYFSHHTLLGKEAGTTFVVVLLALKTLELRAQRDAFVIFFLGFFTLLANFFYSQSLMTAMSMLVGLMGLLTALVISHMPVGKPPLLLAAKTAGSMALLGMPIMLVLFLLFPRMAPLWGLPQDANSGRSGLSDNMKVGMMASVALDDSIAMRIRFQGQVPERSSLYFRGPVLTEFDGREWRSSPTAAQTPQLAAASLQVSGNPIRYEVTLEGNNHPWLLLMDAAPQGPEISRYKAFMDAELQWITDQPIQELVRYRAQSYPRFSYGANLQGSSLARALALPPGFNPRTWQLAADIKSDPRYASADSLALVDAVMERLRSGGYRYTLEPGVFGRDSADEFWFDRKEGFCEHIASAFVLLMRALKVPARVVTGYQGGDVNRVDSFWTVRQSDAHAWAEVWIANQGWTRVDPTSAVAPGRTGTSQRLESQRGALAQALVQAFGTVNPAFALNLRAVWEAANNRWNQWVLTYSQASQLDLLQNLGMQSPSWEDLSYLLLGLLVAASLIGAAWAQWERHQQEPWLRLLAHAGQALSRAGVVVTHHTSPRAMARGLQVSPAINEIGPATVRRWTEWLLRLEAIRYGPTAPGGNAGTKYASATLAALRRDFASLPALPRVKHLPELPPVEPNAASARATP
jgi:transglutaminase-like putative cysteine protease